MSRSTCSRRCSPFHAFLRRDEPARASLPVLAFALGIMVMPDGPTLAQAIDPNLRGTPVVTSCPYSAPANFAVGTNPAGLATRDFNEDGILDLAVANSGSNMVSILLGNGSSGVGDGTFAAAVDYWGIGSPQAIASEDFNSDGILDLAVAGADGISILLGNGSGGIGDGTFGAALNVPGSGSPSDVVAGDFNEDGITDLAVANQARVQIYPGGGSNGIGNGTFSFLIAYAFDTNVSGVTLGDFNADGVLDLAVVRNTWPDASILIGNAVNGIGDGTFASSVDYAVGGGGGEDIVTGDFNEDGATDLAVTLINSGQVGILLGMTNSGVPTGTFQALVQYQVGGGPRGIGVTDVDGDGISDVVVACQDAGHLAVLQGLGGGTVGNGTFAPLQTFGAGNTPFELVLGDFLEDGAPDVVVTNWAAGSVSSLAGICATALSTSIQVTSPNGGGTLGVGSSTTISWTRGDGVMATRVELSRDGGGNWQTLARNITGTTFTWTVSPPTTSTARVRVTDETFASRSDASDANFSIGICFNLVTGALAGSTDGSVAWGDYDNDGDLDMLVTGDYNARVYRNSGGANPTFSDVGASLAEVDSSSAAWGDYDRDGDLDILLTGGTFSASIAKVYRNSGGANPTFSDVGASLTGVSRGSVAWGDYDDDGDLDILLSGKSGSTEVTKVYRNNGGANPTFTDIGAGLPGVSFSSAAWGDYDNDGDLDILLTGSSGSIYIARVYRNSGGPPPAFSDISAGLPGVFDGSADWGDYDNDGDLDILLTGTTVFETITKLYRNSGGANPTFSDISAGLPGVFAGSAAWGDYDNDGDLDILLTGFASASIARVYRNSGGANPTFSDVAAGLPGVASSSVAWGDCDNDGDLDILLAGSGIARVYRVDCPQVANTPPNAPTNLSGNFVEGVARLSWSASTDGQTPPSALSYNLRVGTTPGGSDIASPMANAVTGYRLLPALGNANQNTTWDVRLPAPGTYYWTVQAIDGAFAGSAFASEVTVAVPPSCFTDIGAGLSGTWAGSVAWGDYDNDGDLDILLAGIGSPNYIARVYRSSGGANPTFTDIGAPLQGVAGASVAWGDYDNDGDLDILLAGHDGSTEVTKVYRNSGGANPTFADIGAGLTQVDAATAAWGDYDNDDDLDILVTGEDAFFFPITKLYRSSGGANPTFTEVTAGLPDVSSSSAWGDYDNDDDMDILLTGFDGSTRISRVYRNNGGANPTFTDIDAGLTGVSRSSVAWGDSDNDGDLDILLTGFDGSTRITKLYRNNGGTFADTGMVLPQVTAAGTSGCVAWGDYDTDGHLDMLLTGNSVAFVYRNSGGLNPTFTDIGAFLRGVQGSSAAWGDYDNDGDLDILHTGAASDPFAFISIVYRNNCVVPKALAAVPADPSAVLDGPNTPPTAPTNLYGRIDGMLARFSWNAATDAQTPSGGLCYNLRVGTSPGAADIVNPMANVATGFRRLPALLGNVNQNTTWEVVLPGPGTYYWSVQAVDGGSAGSVFAEEEIPVGVEPNAAPLAHTLSSGGPNPFSGATIIQFSQPAGSWVSLAVYDLAGRRVRTLVNESLRAGRFTTPWDGKDDVGRRVPSGVYFIRMKTSSFVKSHKVSLLR